jgi:hypothetical protein
MPTPRPATLDGVKGSGYAIVVRDRSGRTDHHGVITVDLEGWKALNAAMNEDRDLTFSGVVYDGLRERDVTIAVLVQSITNHGEDAAVVRFVGRGG